MLQLQLMIKQTLGLTNSTVYWSTIAPKPGTSVYVNERQGHNDQLHIAVVDDLGDVTGIKGNILEKHVDFLRQAMLYLMSTHLRRSTLRIISAISLLISMQVRILWQHLMHSTKQYQQRLDLLLTLE